MSSLPSPPFLCLCSTQQPPTFLAWEAEGCERRVPSDRCPPLASGGNLSKRQVGSRGEVSLPAAEFMESARSGCRLWRHSAGIWVFLHEHLRLCMLLFQPTCFEPHFNITPANPCAEAETEVKLNVNVLRKQNDLDDVDIYREKLNLRLFHH